MLTSAASACLFLFLFSTVVPLSSHVDSKSPLSVYVAKSLPSVLIPQSPPKSPPQSVWTPEHSRSSGHQPAAHTVSDAGRRADRGQSHSWHDVEDDPDTQCRELYERLFTHTQRWSSCAARAGLAPFSICSRCSADARRAVHTHALILVICPPAVTNDDPLRMIDQYRRHILSVQSELRCHLCTGGAQVRDDVTYILNRHAHLLECLRNGVSGGSGADTSNVSVCDVCRPYVDSQSKRLVPMVIEAYQQHGGHMCSDIRLVVENTKRALLDSGCELLPVYRQAPVDHSWLLVYIMCSLLLIGAFAIANCVRE